MSLAAADRRFFNHAPPWLVLATLPPAAIVLTAHLPAWVFMAAISLSLYFGFKWLTLARFLQFSPAAGRRRALAYLLAWPGMDAAAFLGSPIPVPRPQTREWFTAIGKTLLGAALFWGVARLAAPHSELAAGWIGMIGIVLMLHFGLFHVLALAWRSRGVDALPLMNRPLMAASVSDFWSHRWNLAFRDLAFRTLFRPLIGRFGAAGATLAVFFASGIVHELAISLPARGGYGLPTVYFLVQGLAMLAERTSIGRAIALGSGIAGRLFAWAIVAGGAFWLFHPPFVQRVVVPMMHALGAM